MNVNQIVTDMAYWGIITNKSQCFQGGKDSKIPERRKTVVLFLRLWDRKSNRNVFPKFVCFEYKSFSIVL